MIRAFLGIFLVIVSHFAYAQNPTYVKEMIDSLCAPRYHGRGYVSHGDVLASEFLKSQCQAKGLEPIGESFFQPFELAVNTYPGAMRVALDDVALTTGVDFIIQPHSPGIKGSFKAFHFNNKWIGNREKLFKLSLKEKVQNSVVVIDATEDTEAMKAFLTSLMENPLKAKGYVVLTHNKHTWSVGRRLIGCPIIMLTASAAPKKFKTVHLDIDQEWVDTYKAQNVIAKIDGPGDSILVYTAHYDHLGRMGADTYIAGASDNASGTAMLLDLADFYLKNPPKHDVVFIWFAGEEAGLVGSRHFVENPTIELEKIRFLMNLDLMADAKQGITAVNGKVFTDEFETLEAINEEYKFVDVVKSRGSAANSDHYPFYEVGVPCFFVYTMGDYTHYHDVNDIPENIPLTKYSEVYRLIVMFMDRF